MTTVLARAAGASRRYGDVVALDDVSVDVHAGELAYRRDEGRRFR